MFNDHLIFSNNIHDAAAKLHQIKNELNEDKKKSSGRTPIMPGSMPSIMNQLQNPPAAQQQGNLQNTIMNLFNMSPQNTAQAPAASAAPSANQGFNFTQAGTGTKPNQFAQMAGGIMKAIDDVRRGVTPNVPTQGFDFTKAGTGTKPNKYAQYSGGIMKALDDIRRGLPSNVTPTAPAKNTGVTPESDIQDYLKVAGKQSGTRLSQETIPMGDPNNPATYMPGNVSVSNRPSPAQFNQQAMQPGGVYQMDQSGYVQSYLPAYQNKSQNTAPARVKTQPQQPEPVEGEYWKSPTERVVPTQQPAPAQQQTPAPAAQPQQQNWGAFGMRGQSPEEINAWNNQVAQKQGPQNQVAQKQTIVPSGGMENVNKNLSVVQQQPQQVPTQRTAIMPGSMPQVMNQVQNQYGNDQIEWMGIQPPPKNLGKGLQNTINDILTLGKRS